MQLRISLEKWGKKRNKIRAIQFVWFQYAN